MYFKYSREFYVSDDNIDEMKERIKNGVNPKDVFEDWRATLDDAVYYTVDYVREQIMKELTNI